jgi:hypothetical protein
MRAFLSVVLCALLLLTTACSKTLLLIEAIVSAVEIALPATGVSPADAAKFTKYSTEAMTSASNLLAAGASAASIEQAIVDFDNITVPELSAGASADTRMKLANITAAINNFIKAFQGPPVAGVRVSRPSAVPTLKDTPQLMELRARIDAAKAQLRRRGQP